MKKLNKKGFTLIELLAVIVILGVLMLVAIPAVTRYINKSRRETFKSNAVALIDAARNQIALNGTNTGTCYMNIGFDATNGNMVELEKKLANGYNGYIEYTYSAGGGTYKITLTDGRYNISEKTEAEIDADASGTIADGAATLAAKTSDLCSIN